MTVKENLLRAIAHDAPDHVPYYGEGGIQFVSHRGALPPDDGRDLWGVRWEKRVAESLPYPVEHPACTVGELASLALPDPRALTDALPPPDPDSLVVGCHYMALFERLHCLCGMENALVWMLEETAAVGRFLVRLADWHLEIARAFVDHGIEAGRISDDYGAQTGLLMSASLWRAAVEPALSRLVGFYKRGGRIVMLHSCGALEPIMDDLVGMGIDVFNIQTSANDLPAYKAKYGTRITFMGGLDTRELLTRGSPRMVKSKVKAAVASLGRGGGLILEPDQRVSMPEENLRALVEAARLHGVYSRRDEGRRW